MLHSFLCQVLQRKYTSNIYVFPSTYWSPIYILIWSTETAFSGLSKTSQSSSPLAFSHFHLSLKHSIVSTPSCIERLALVHYRFFCSHQPLSSLSVDILSSNTNLNIDISQGSMHEHKFLFLSMFSHLSVLSRPMTWNTPWMLIISTYHYLQLLFISQGQPHFTLQPHIFNRTQCFSSF